MFANARPAYAGTSKRNRPMPPPADSGGLEEAFGGGFLPDDSLVDPAMARTREAIAALGLENRAFDRNPLGYTVLTPAELDTGDLAVRLCDALLDIAAAKAGGVRPDLDGDAPGAWTAVGQGQFLHHVLFRNPVF